MALIDDHGWRCFILLLFTPDRQGESPYREIISLLETLSARWTPFESETYHEDCAAGILEAAGALASRMTARGTEVCLIADDGTDLADFLRSGPSSERERRGLVLRHVFSRARSFTEKTLDEHVTASPTFAVYAPDASENPAPEKPNCRESRGKSASDINGDVAKYIKKHPDPSQKDVAKAVGASQGTVGKTDAWKAHMADRNRRRDAKSVRLAAESNLGNGTREVIGELLDAVAQNGRYTTTGSESDPLDQIVRAERQKLLDDFFQRMTPAERAAYDRLPPEEQQRRLLDATGIDLDD